MSAYGKILSFTSKDGSRVDAICHVKSAPFAPIQGSNVIDGVLIIDKSGNSESCDELTAEAMKYVAKNYECWLKEVQKK